nr:hypothetical protein GCM10020092_093730 [Actinoplanes digitatis]
MERVSGRHRRNFSLRGAGVVASAMAIVVVLAGSWLGYQSLADAGCTGQIKLTVAAATEIAPAVEQAAQQWTAGGANVNGTCVAVSVSGVNPATTASTVAAKHGVSLTGIGSGGKSAVLPDVWIADSSTWLLRLRSEASGFVPTDGKSIAKSPVVVAMPEPIAQQVGWPDKKLTWKDLLQQMTTGNSLRTGIVDPTRDSAGLAGLLALGGAAGAGPEAKATQVGALRALAAGSSSLRDDLMQKFPRSLDAADLASAVSAAPLSEEDVIAYNAERPQVKLAALYLDQTPSLDYPFAVMPEVDLTRSAAATGLREALQQPSFKDQLASVGLRAPRRHGRRRLLRPGRCAAGQPARRGTRDRHRGHRRGGPRRRLDQPGAGQLGRHHPAGPRARRLRRVGLDARQGADGPQRGPRNGDPRSGVAGPRALRRQVGGRRLALLDRDGRQAALEADRADQPAHVEAGRDPGVDREDQAEAERRHGSLRHRAGRVQERAGHLAG